MDVCPILFLDRRFQRLLGRGFGLRFLDFLQKHRDGVLEMVNRLEDIDDRVIGKGDAEGVTEIDDPLL